MGVTIVVVVLLIAGFFIWRSQGTVDDPTGGKGIPRTDGLSDNQKAGMEIMNRAPRPDMPKPTQ